MTVQSSAPDRLHFWFRSWNGSPPEYVSFRFEGGAVKADTGRCFLVPPSLHPSGAVYAFLASPEDTEIAVLPEQRYLELVRLYNGDSARLRRQLESEPGAKIPHGQQHDTLVSIAGTMRRRGLTADEIFVALWKINRDRCEVPGPEENIRQIADSVALYRPAKTNSFSGPPIGTGTGGIESQGLSGDPVEGTSPGASPEGSLPFQRLSVLVENAPAEPAWTWRGYLAEAVLALLAGRPKVGKSTLVFALIAAAVRGDPFLGLEAKARGVLLLTEERRDTLAEKARILGLMDAEVPVYALSRHDAGTRPWPEVVRDAMAFCREHDLDVLIVDTLDRWTGLRGDAENAAGAVNEAMEPLQFAAAAGLAVLALSHQRKSGGEFGEAVRGSNAFTGAVDVVIELERPARSLQLGSHARVLRSVSRFSSTPEELFFELADDGFLPIENVVDRRTDAERAQTLETLKRHGDPITLDDLFELVDLGKRVLRGRLNELLEQGLVVRTGAGKKGDPYLWVAVEEPAE